jgi:hypothetical protein
VTIDVAWLLALTSRPGGGTEGYRALKSISKASAMRVSKVPAEWAADTWTMHRVGAYKQMALAPEFDYFLRVWFFAAANVRANGHAPLKQRMLANALGREVGGNWVPASTHTVRDAIARAKSKNLLDASSRALCLVPSRDIVAQGMGDPSEPCLRHPEMRRRSRLARIA